jgi:hypothetical protein
MTVPASDALTVVHGQDHDPRRIGRELDVARHVDSGPSRQADVEDRDVRPRVEDQPADGIARCHRRGRTVVGDAARERRDLRSSHIHDVDVVAVGEGRENHGVVPRGVPERPFRVERAARFAHDGTHDEVVR